MHRCQAMVLIPGSPNSRRPEGMFVMCGNPDADMHHKLTRARGGLILDAVGETYHHLWLCRQHHGVAHDEDTAYTAGLLIRGLVVSRPDGSPLYTGPDEYLNEHYGEGARV